ncbi:MAG: hypothetical protein HOA17_01225 [Candidatus Melainabacteria bacterium]|jgi:hypothetical protein|nr:hypothetical protein [Candidatus Melainabacteria bacterium]
MDKRENMKAKMFRGVREVLDRNQAVIEKIPAFQMSYTDFKAAVANIDANDQKYQNVTNGVTSKKDEIEDALIETLLSLSSSTSVFARRTGDNALKETVKVRPSRLKRMRDMDLLTKAKQIHGSISTNEAGLAKYGVSKNDIDNLGKRVADFEKAIQVQEDSFAQAKAARQDLGEGFEYAEDIINEELDQLIERIAEANANFYKDYQTNRRLEDF